MILQGQRRARVAHGPMAPCALVWLCCGIGQRKKIGRSVPSSEPGLQLLQARLGELGLSIEQLVSNEDGRGLVHGLALVEPLAVDSSSPLTTFSEEQRLSWVGHGRPPM